jgi:4-amino-4-deoxy-L-arabinose transferase-like glycosyltransferase
MVGNTSALVTLCAVLTLALTWNLSAYPAPWFDEGHHIAAAATLARHGVYGAPQAGAIVPFDPAVLVGPPIILPVAASFAVFGVGVLQARIVMVLFALCAAWVLWRTARHLVGDRAALLAMAVVVAGTPEPFASFVFMGRHMVGEVPALGFFLAGLLLLPAGRDEGPASAWRLTLSGLAFGAAMLTKGQLLFVGGAALGLAWVLDRVYYRQRPWFEVPVALAVGVGCVGAWQLIQYVALDPAQFAEHTAVLRSGLTVQIFAFDPIFWRNAAGALWRSGFLVWGAVGVVWAVRRARVQDASGHAHARLAALALLGLCWFAMLSVGWARYALYPTVLLPIWTSDALLSWWDRFRRDGRATPAWRVAAVAVLAMALLWQARVWTAHVLAPPETGFVAMRDFVRREVPPDAMVESWEWEFMAEPHPRFSRPGVDVMFEVTRYVMRQQPAPSDLYDPLARRPDYLLQGPFGGWTGIYRELIERPTTGVVAHFGSYRLYSLGDAGTRR